MLNNVVGYWAYIWGGAYIWSKVSVSIWGGLIHGGGGGYIRGGGGEAYSRRFTVVLLGSFPQANAGRMN
jgi:hypothetical protein